MKLFFRKKLSGPIEAFIQDSRSVGILLLGCTMLSLLMANSSQWGLSYQHFWVHPMTEMVSERSILSALDLPHSALDFINDGLMALFFFLAGMEIKRELFDGELSSVQQSILPICAAVGGMMLPAIFFACINKGSAYLSGWAIPTATDIAFTLGIASLLGKRVPMGLRIFLTALAIIDDLGAIIVIACFYGAHVQWWYIAGVMAITAILLLINYYKIRWGYWHLLLGILLWYCMLHSGIHATVAGVLLAFLIPVNALKPLERAIHVPVYFIIIPLFALANTAIPLPLNSVSSMLHSGLSWGILAGLILGKPIGICLTCYVLVQKKWARLPENTGWYQLLGAGMLAGIGFTMSIFISTLAFHQAADQQLAKISVLVASCISMILGYAWFALTKK